MCGVVYWGAPPGGGKKWRGRLCVGRSRAVSHPVSPRSKMGAAALARHAPPQKTGQGHGGATRPPPSSNPHSVSFRGQHRVRRRRRRQRWVGGPHVLLVRGGRLLGPLLGLELDGLVRGQGGVGGWGGAGSGRAQAPSRSPHWGPLAAVRGREGAPGARARRRRAAAGRRVARQPRAGGGAPPPPPNGCVPRRARRARRAAGKAAPGAPASPPAPPPPSSLSPTFHLASTTRPAAGRAARGARGAVRKACIAGGCGGAADAGQESKQSAPLLPRAGDPCRHAGVQRAPSRVRRPPADAHRGPGGDSGRRAAPRRGAADGPGLARASRAPMRRQQRRQSRCVRGAGGQPPPRPRRPRPTLAPPRPPASRRPRSRRPPPPTRRRRRCRPRRPFRRARRGSTWAKGAPSSTTRPSTPTAPSSPAGGRAARWG